MKALESDISKINNSIEKMASMITEEITRRLQAPNKLITTTVKTFADRETVMEQNTKLIMAKLGITQENSDPPNKTN